MTAIDPVAALHERLFTIDTHIDTPTSSLVRPGWDFAARHDYATDHSQCDLPRMREGGIDALVFAVYVGQMGRSPKGLAAAHDIALRIFDRTHAVLREQAVAGGLALTAEDARRLNAEGRRAFFLSIENAYSVGRDLAHVAKFHRLGVRMMGLTHMLNNDVADSSTDPKGAEWGGLSGLGRELVVECNRLGIVVDGSHASDDAVWQLLETSRAPIVLSHTDCRALSDHRRNVGDDLLRALAARGGVIQMNALPVSLVTPVDAAHTAAFMELFQRYQDTVPTPEAVAAAERDFDTTLATVRKPRATLDDLVRHIEHAVEIAGIDHVGIGCDFDGGGGVEGLNDVSEYPNLTRALVARGWRETDLAKLWSENTLRVLRAADSLAVR